MKKLIGLSIVSLAAAAALCWLLPGKTIYAQEQLFQSFNYPTGLVGWWKLCGDINATGGCAASTSATVYDSSGNGNSGTWSGTQSGTTDWYSAGKVGPYAGHFNGTNNYVNIGNAALLNFTNTNPFSACAWVNNAGTGPTDGEIVTKNSAVSPYQGWSFSINSGVLYVYLTNTATNVIVVKSGSTISASTWTHVCFTYSGSSNASGVLFYINGAPVTNTIVTNALTGTIATTGSVNIGTYGTGTGGFITGLIDDVRVYNRALMPGEIALMALEHN
jgi:hypothetical protein